jgi:hypothetical protein
VVDTLAGVLKTIAGGDIKVLHGWAATLRSPRGDWRLTCTGAAAFQVPCKAVRVLAATHSFF